jgi:hypothetical protein
MDSKSRPRRSRIAWTITLALALSLGAIATASAKDRNQDRIPDRWERQNDLSLQVNQARRDQDNDALANRGEYRAGTDPHRADTDGDGLEDGDEGAGTISAWDPETGELTINLFGGDQVSGTVTDETEIECANDDADQPDEEVPAKASPPGAADPEEDPAEPAPDAPPPPHGGPHGPDHAGEHDCDGTECSVDDLAVDKVVEEASLRLTSDGLVFDEIQLG